MATPRDRRSGFPADQAEARLLRLGVTWFCRPHRIIPEGWVKGNLRFNDLGLHPIIAVDIDVAWYNYSNGAWHNYTILVELLVHRDRPQVPITQ